MAEKVGLVIAVDKPLQWTSFQVVNKVKWQLRRNFGLKKFKIGHAGTLDPLASGLLLICVGNATKKIEELQQGIKEYSGTMVLGATTPCYDLEQAVDHLWPFNHITPELIETTRQSFVGEQEQVPPMFSAVKINGKRAYLSARDGSVADIAPKKITIYDFQISQYRPASVSENEIKISAPAEGRLRDLYKNPQGEIPPGLPQIDFRVTCSKGTYIRSLARDFGLVVGSGAFLCKLRRVKIGDYRVDDALSIEDIETTLTPDNPTYSPLLSLSNG